MCLFIICILNWAIAGAKNITRTTFYDIYSLSSNNNTMKNPPKPIKRISLCNFPFPIYLFIMIFILNYPQTSDASITASKIKVFQVMSKGKVQQKFQFIFTSLNTNSFRKHFHCISVVTRKLLEIRSKSRSPFSPSLV